MAAPGADRLSRNTIFVWVASATSIILLVPLIAMQLTDEVSWNAADVLVMGALLFGTGLIFVVLARRWRRYRVLIGVMLAAVLLWLWAELAVGVFTSWGS